MNNIAPVMQKCWTHKIAFKVISKTVKEPNFFYCQPSKLPKNASAKFYLSFYDFWFKFYDMFCTPYSILDLLRIFNHQNRKPYPLIWVEHLRQKKQQFPIGCFWLMIQDQMHPIQFKDGDFACTSTDL